MGNRNTLPLVETLMPQHALLDQISRDAEDAWLKPSTVLINMDQAEQCQFKCLRPQNREAL